MKYRKLPLISPGLIQLCKGVLGGLMGRITGIQKDDWPIEQCYLHIRVFFGEKKKSIHLADKTNNEHLPKLFFKVITYENRSKWG